MIDEIRQHFGHDLLILRATRMASVLLFRDKAIDVFKMVADEDDYETEVGIQKVVKEVKLETKTFSTNKDIY